MSPARVESRKAASIVIVLSLAAQTTVVGSRPAPAQSLDQAQLRGLEPVPPLQGLRPTPSDGASGGLDEPRRRSPIAPSYGRPRVPPRLPKPYPPPARLQPPTLSPTVPLPPLEPYKTSIQAKEQARRAARLKRQGLRGTLEALTRPPPPTVAVVPTIKTKPRPTLEANPYDPLGFGIGSLRLYAFAEPSYGYDTNPNRLASDVHGSKFFRVDAGFKLRSEWARDDLLADLRLGYVDYFSVANADRPDGRGSFLYRYDVARETEVKVEGRFTLDTQRPGAPGLVSTLPNVVVTNRPTIVTLGTSAGLTQRFNRLEATMRGSFDRWLYQNAYYSDGSVLDLSSTNYNVFALTPRLAYELTPHVKPFVEATVDRRTHDAYLDPYGYARDSRGWSARAGTTLKFTDLVKGEVSAGYAKRVYDDPRLPALRGPVVDAALIYTATPLTTVTLRGATVLNETTLAGAAGVLTRNVTAQVSHALLRNLTVTATGSYQTNNYQGASTMERVTTAGVKLEYNITRAIVIKGSYYFERLDSTLQGADYTANVFLAGLRFQP